MVDPKLIGLLGGTFDPIHFGHLRAALEIYEQCQLKELLLIPCKNPPHRSTPLAAPEHRFAMAKLAVQNTPLRIDDREMKREGPSYSIDTLASLRKEFPKSSLCLILGVDAFLGLPTWHQGEKILQLCNIIVIGRKGWEISPSASVMPLLQACALGSDETLQDFTAGKIIQQTITSLDISASLIRNFIQNGRSPQFLLPENVYHYILKHSLYAHLKKIQQIQEENTK